MKKTKWKLAGPATERHMVSVSIGSTIIDWWDILADASCGLT